VTKIFVFPELRHRIVYFFTFNLFFPLAEKEKVVPAVTSALIRITQGGEVVIETKILVGFVNVFLVCFRVLQLSFA